MLDEIDHKTFAEEGGEQDEGKNLCFSEESLASKRKNLSHFFRFALNALVLAHYYFNAKNKTTTTTTATNQENIQELKERNELNRTILNSLQQHHLITGTKIKLRNGRNASETTLCYLSSFVFLEFPSKKEWMLDT